MAPLLQQRLRPVPSFGAEAEILLYNTIETVDTSRIVSRTRGIDSIRIAVFGNAITIHSMCHRSIYGTVMEL